MQMTVYNAYEVFPNSVRQADLRELYSSFYRILIKNKSIYTYIYS